MRAYLVYDRQTGKIVHRHRQSADLEHERVPRTEERIFNLIDPSLDRDRLDIIVVEDEEMKRGTSYRVNPDTKRLEEMP